jgi:hypothetical protein
MNLSSGSGRQCSLPQVVDDFCPSPATMGSQALISACLKCAPKLWRCALACSCGPGKLPYNERIPRPLVTTRSSKVDDECLKSLLRCLAGSIPLEAPRRPRRGCSQPWHSGDQRPERRLFSQWEILRGMAYVSLMVAVVSANDGKHQVHHDAGARSDCDPDRVFRC